MLAVARGPRSETARAAWQGPSHAWLPWAVAGVAGMAAWLLGRGAAGSGLVALVALAGGAGAYLAWREPVLVGTRVLPALALALAVVAIALVLVPESWAAARLAPAALALAVGCAHAPIVQRAAQRFSGLSWARGGFAAMLLVALIALVAASRQPGFDPWLLVIPAAVALELTWLPLLLRARRDERDPARPMRFACPRCGTVQSRAAGKGPCEGCGLFVLFDRTPPDARPQPVHPTPAEPIWLLCPTCRLRLRAPRGHSACPQCRTELWAEWNVHVIGERPSAERSVQE